MLIYCSRAYLKAGLTHPFHKQMISGKIRDKYGSAGELSMEFKALSNGRHVVDITIESSDPNNSPFENLLSRQLQNKEISFYFGGKKHKLVKDPKRPSYAIGDSSYSLKITKEGVTRSIILNSSGVCTSAEVCDEPAKPQVDVQLLDDGNVLVITTETMTAAQFDEKYGEQFPHIASVL